MGRKFAIVLLLVLTALIWDAQLYKAFAQSVVFKSMEVKEDDNAVKILISGNKSIPVECYDLSTPAQIVVDFLGDIYTDYPEITMINKGTVKQMRVIKGTKKSPELGDSFYALDFVIFDLKEGTRYDIDQGLTNIVLNIFKPGKTPAPKPAIQPAPVPPAPVQEAKSEISSPEVQPAKTPAVVAATPAPKPQVKEPAVRETKIKDESVPESVAPKKGVLGKVGGFLGFDKKKQSAKKSEVKVSRKRTVKSDREKPKKQSAKKDVEQPEPVLEKKAAEPAPTKKDTRETAAAKKDAAKRVKSAQKKLDQINAEIGKLEKDAGAAKTKVAAAEKEEQEFNSRINDKLSEQKKLQEDLDMNIKSATVAKDSANDAWEDYNQAKSALNDLLTKGAMPEELASAETKYEDAKKALEAVINKAETARSGLNARQQAYNEATSAVEDLKAQLAAFSTKKNLAQSEHAEIEAKLKSAKEEKAAIEKELAQAQRDNLQYTLEKDDLEYKKSIMKLDETIAAQDAEKAPAPAQAKEVAVESKPAIVKKEVDISEMKAELEKEEPKAEIAKAEAPAPKVEPPVAVEAEALPQKVRSKKINAVKKQQDARQKKEEERKTQREERLAEIKKAKEEKAKEEARLAALEIARTQQVKPEAVAEEVEAEKPTENVSNISPKRRSAYEPAKKKILDKQSSAKKPEILETAVELRQAGLRMQKAGDFDSALKYYQQALLEEPNFVSVHNDLGILYEQKGADEKAKAEYMLALKIDPHYTQAHSNLALLYEKAGDYNKAYYHWKQRVLFGDPNDPWTLKAKQRMESLEQKRK